MHEIIAIIFDFDDTLAPDSTSGYLAQCGVDVPRFWKEEVKALTETRSAPEEWDPVPAYLYKMIEKSSTGQIEPITRESLAGWGRRLPLYPGVETIFSPAAGCCSRGKSPGHPGILRGQFRHRRGVAKYVHRP